MIQIIHKRLRLFNIRDTYSEQKLDRDPSQGVFVCGTMVFLRYSCADKSCSIWIAAKLPVSAE